MSESQRPEDDVGSRPQEKGGKKKPATESQVPATDMGKKSVSEIRTQYAEQDELDGVEIEDLAPVMEEDEPEEDGYASVEGEEDQGTEEKIAARRSQSQEPAQRNPNSVQSSALAKRPSLSRPSGDSESGQIGEEQQATSDNDSGSHDDGGQEESEEADEQFVEKAVDTANEFEDRQDTTRLEYAMWGFNTFFDGNVEAALERSHGRKRKYSKFLANERLKTKPRRVSDLIRGAATWTGFINDGFAFLYVTFSHCLEMAAVEDGAIRLELAKEIEQKRLSVRKTRERVQEINSKKADPRLIEKLLAKIKDPRSLPVSKDYERMDEEFLENELSKKERLLLRAEMDTKREQLKICSDFLDLLEKRLSDIDL